MQSELHCLHCGHRSCKVDPFLDISLSLDMAAGRDARSEATSPAFPLVDLTAGTGAEAAVNGTDAGASMPSRGPRGGSPDLSLTVQECLQHFTALETLSEQVYCDACKEPRPTKKRLSVSTSPRVLVLHFKRFDSIRQLKLCVKVDFPLRGLDLEPFMHHDPGNGSSNGATDSCLHPRGPADSPYLYDLQGVVSHKGSLTQVS
jgi:hypothetical protein